MSMRDLIPWGRSSETAPVPLRSSEVTPLVSLRREVDRLFDDFFRWPAAGFSDTAGIWPSIDIREDDREVHVSAELPGMSERDIELLAQDGVMTIRGEKNSETGDKDRGYSERWFGRFERRIPLPAGVDEEQANAIFRDGVLSVTFPRTTQAVARRRIPINAETRH